MKGDPERGPCWSCQQAAKMKRPILTVTESGRLHELEDRIQRGLNDVGSALREVRDEKLWRRGYDSFEDYCKRRWNVTPNYANRQIAAAAVIENLVPIGTTPASEAVARPLTR